MRFLSMIRIDETWDVECECADSMGRSSAARPDAGNHATFVTRAVGLAALG